MEQTQESEQVAEESLGFVVSHQKVELTFDFTTRTIIGNTQITILPQHRKLKSLRFNARQMSIPVKGVTVNHHSADFKYEDEYRKIDLPKKVLWGVEQYDMQKDRILPLINANPQPGSLCIAIPRQVRIEDVNPLSDNAPAAIKDRYATTAGVRSSSAGVFGPPTPVTTPRLAEDSLYAPLSIDIKFRTDTWREGLKWIGTSDDDLRYPHVYSMHSPQAGPASCIFPCVDDPSMRCTWEIIVRCGKTLGDALKPAVPAIAPRTVQHLPNGKRRAIVPDVSAKPDAIADQPDSSSKLNSEDKQLEMVVVCSADQTNEISDPDDHSRKIVSFLCSNQVAARHIGFAVGPFNTVDLSDIRDTLEDDKLGQKMVQVTAYCLPGRNEEVRNVCVPLPSAVDYFSKKFGSYPFSDYKICFIEDQLSNTVPLASLALCSTRLLLSEEVIDPLVENTHDLVHALASQWMGVHVTANSRSDTWAVVGISRFMSEHFMSQLCGNNEYRFRQKTRSDKLVELDIARPSLYALGDILPLGSFELSFMELKAPLVLFILDRRLLKSSISHGLVRVLSRLFYTASTSDSPSDKTISTDSFRKLCDKIGQSKTDTFFTQWIMGAGCPRFAVNQRFNKKRLVVEMTVTQTQHTLPTQRKLEKEAFLRELKEEVNGVYAGDVQSFTGPMTIRIHEADGTPYEHIVSINEPEQKFEIPYHTKYKRLKRSKYERERQNLGAVVDVNGDNENDVLLYCLGDVLQSVDEIKDWQLHDWDADTKAKMENESYEWIRMDADFEWLCEMNVHMPAYMFVSQLQQDRDVVAQQDSMLFLSKTPAHPLVSTILARTLMDKRYFHGIRTMAAEYLPHHAVERLQWIGRSHLEKAFQHFFCHNDAQSMPKSNDFSNKQMYLIQLAITRAMARIRNENDKCPIEARRFILDQLRFNDNHSNDFSDHFYVANLMQALTLSLLPTKTKEEGEMTFSFESEDEDEVKSFINTACEEIDRYRRMDEWDPSYQNLYTVTALECKQRLMEANVIPVDGVYFLRYAHGECADIVRVKALEALVHLRFFAKDSFIKYFLHMLSNDPSPYARNRLMDVFGLALAGIAFGEQENNEDADEPAPGEVDGLIIDADPVSEARKTQLLRTMSIEGALVALKAELNPVDEPENNVSLRTASTFKSAIWDAIGSGILNAWEQNDLLDVCSVLVDPVETMKVRLRMPRVKTAYRLGKNIVVFKETQKLRTKPYQPPVVPVKKLLSISRTPLPSATNAPARTPLPQLTSQIPPRPQAARASPLPSRPHFSPPPPSTPAPVPTPVSTATSVRPAVSGSMKPPAKRPLPPSRPGSSAERPSKIVCLKLTKSALSHYPRGTSGHIPAALQQKAPASPRPRPAASPLQTIPGTTVPAPAARTPLPSIPSGTGTPGARKPLPTMKIATASPSPSATPVPAPQRQPPAGSASPPPGLEAGGRQPSLKIKFHVGTRFPTGPGGAS